MRTEYILKRTISSSRIGDFIAKICRCCTDERVSCSDMEQMVRKEGVMDYGSDESCFCSTHLLWPFLLSLPWVCFTAAKPAPHHLCLFCGFKRLSFYQTRFQVCACVCWCVLIVCVLPYAVAWALQSSSGPDGGCSNATRLARDQRNVTRWPPFLCYLPPSLIYFYHIAHVFLPDTQIISQISFFMLGFDPVSQRVLLLCESRKARTQDVTLWLYRYKKCTAQ